MNLKLVKSLRRNMRKNDGIDLYEPRRYLVKLTKNGTRKTYYNDPESPRAKYQQRKKELRNELA